MTSYLLKVLITVIFSFLIIYNYYTVGDFLHIESFSSYNIYLAIIGVIYLIYRGFYYLLGYKKIIFTPFKIFLFFLLHLFVLSIFFFQLSPLSISNSLMLFFQIVFYTILPITIILISLSFGKKLISTFLSIEGYSKIFNFLISLGIGFTSFIFLLDIIGFLGQYNLIAFFGILLVFIVISYREFIDIVKGIFNYKISFNIFNINEGKYLRLFSTEFLFIIATLILSVNLISIIRPFPIGWDDLGAYMNIPHLLADAGSLKYFSSMYAWQTFTGIGYMFDFGTQAFFLNNVGGFLSFIVLTLIISDLLDDKKLKQKTFINIPLLIGTIFISMPMVIFEQAKDMKLDPGLFFISIISLYVFYKLVLFNNEKDGISNILINSISIDKKKRKNNYKLLFIIGLLAGFAFTIKFTSLILIIGIIGVLFFVRFGLTAFLGYLSIFFAIFTKMGLWKYMNVVYPKDDKDFINIFSNIAFAIGLGLLVYSFNKNKNGVKSFFIKLTILILGILISIMPWVIKNINSSYPDISVGKILSGKSSNFKIDYNKIYSDKELENIKNNLKSGMNSSGTTSNEDYGRYFGYEKGINNYVKLPWNLTMQLNQKGEFTDITYIFLALIPILLLFLPFRKKYYSYGILLILALELSIFLIPGIKGILTDLMTTIGLPLGYSIILALFLLPLIYFLYTLKRTKLSNLFLLNLVFFSSYCFLWTISAFGIVWYGITMYFSLLLMIALGFNELSKYDEKEIQKNKDIKLLGSISIFIIISIYFILSSLPHALNNLKSAGYLNYKTGKITSQEAVFIYHREYLPILFNLNIKDKLKREFILEKIEDIDNNMNFFSIKNLIIEDNIKNISNIIALLNELGNRNKDIEFQKSIKKTKLNIYKEIINPEKKYKSDAVVYRIGTFLKYFITENNKRLFEDSLITNFDNYIFSGNIDNTVENIKKLGLSYMLVDLNAATIDRDPRHDLTRRYENLLFTFTSEKLELIETDSICLKIALEDYKKTKKTEKDYSNYMIIAGVNYESYTSNSKVIPRGNKLLACYDYIDKLIKENKIDKDNYTYLLGFKQYIEVNKINSKKELYTLLQKAYSHGYKALFKVK